MSQDQQTQKLQVQYNNYNEILTQLQSQLSAITGQINEHVIVDSTLTKLENREGRKCFKMIGGVLVNKSVDEVAGILNHDLKVMTSQKGLLEEELVSKRKEMDTWMKDNKVKIVKQ